MTVLKSWNTKGKRCSFGHHWQKAICFTLFSIDRSKNNKYFVFFTITIFNFWYSSLKDIDAEKKYYENIARQL